MSKGSYLHEYLTNLPDFIFDYIEIYYTGESINTQIGYSIDLRIFLEYLQKFRFKSVENLEDFTCEHMGEVKAQDIIRFKAYLKEYESTYISPDGKKVTRTRRNSSFGINRKLSSVRGLFSYLYKTDQISENVTDKIDMNKLHQQIKKPLSTQETMRLLDILYNGERFLNV